jgi:putative hydrolase of HD superfamily
MRITDSFLEFITKSQLLKSTTRHSWTANKRRQESTAEHTWHMTLMAMALEPHIKHKINLLHTLKMITVHDLGEALTGDIPAFSKKHENKYEAEEKAIINISQTLDHLTKKEIVALWREYSEKKTSEALFVKALDVIDVLFQHLISDISRWTKKEYSFNLQRFSENYFLDDPVLLDIYNEINDRLVKKVKKEGKKEWI